MKIFTFVCAIIICLTISFCLLAIHDVKKEFKEYAKNSKIVKIQPSFTRLMWIEVKFNESTFYGAHWFAYPWRKVEVIKWVAKITDNNNI